MVVLAFSLGAASGFLFGSSSYNPKSPAALIKNIFTETVITPDDSGLSDTISTSSGEAASGYPAPGSRDTNRAGLISGYQPKAVSKTISRKSVSTRKKISSVYLANVSNALLGLEKSGNRPAGSGVSDKVTTAEPGDLYCNFSTGSDPSRKILINEIAWMGSPAAIRASISDPSDAEWIELKNNTLQSVDLSGWQLLDRTGKFKLRFPDGARALPSGYFLLERSSDEAVVGISADLTFKDALVNSGMRLKLFDASCNLVDEINASAKWPGGTNDTKQTLERDLSGKGWHTSVFAGGTPKALNTSPADYSAPVGQGTLAAVEAYGLNKSAPPSGSGSGNSGISYPALVISEIQLSSSSSTHQEFVEIWNPNSSSIDLTGWYLQKKTKTAKDYSTFAPKDLFAGKNISAGGFLLIAHPSSTISADIYSGYGLSDDNSLILKNPDGEVTDLVGWGEAGDCESGCASDPADNQSIQRKALAGRFTDSENNSADFEISDCPSPGAFATTVCGGNPGGGASGGTGTGSGSGAGSGSGTGTGSGQSATSSPNIILIAAVQITGGTGKTDNDFVKLYNPGSTAVDLSGWKLRKRVSSGSESSIKQMSSGDVIPAGGYFIWANSKDGFDVSIGANVSTTGTLSSNNSLGLIRPDDSVSDALAWGSGLANPFVESLPYPTNPAANQVLTRKSSATGLEDTNNNSVDFEIK